VIADNIGEIMLESGNTVMLIKDSVMTLKYSDCERLIQQGFVIRT